MATALSMETPPIPKSKVLMSQRLSQSKTENHSSSQFIDNYGTCRDTQLFLFHFPVTVHISKYEFCTPKMKFRETQPLQSTLFSAYTTGLASGTFPRFLKLQPSLHNHSQVCNIQMLSHPSTAGVMKGNASPSEITVVHRFWEFPISNMLLQEHKDISLSKNHL